MEKFFEVSICPLSKPYSLQGAQTITNSQNQIKVIVSQMTPHQPFPFWLDRRKFPDDCISAQLFLLKDIFDMKGDILLGRPKQFGNFQLIQPDTAIPYP